MEREASIFVFVFRFAIVVHLCALQKKFGQISRFRSEEGIPFINQFPVTE